MGKRLELVPHKRKYLNDPQAYEKVFNFMSYQGNAN